MQPWARAFATGTGLLFLLLPGMRRPLGEPGHRFVLLFILRLAKSRPAPTVPKPHCAVAPTAGRSTATRRFIRRRLGAVHESGQTEDGRRGGEGIHRPSQALRRQGYQAGTMRIFVDAFQQAAK
jgi:hypothetical protein